jgi:hypothetical protein
VLGLGNTLSGGIVPAAAAVVDFADAKSLAFDGSNDYLDISDFTFTNQNISISFWAKPQTPGTGDTIIAGWVDVASDTWWKRWILQFNATEGLRWYFGDGTDYWGTNTGDINFTNNTWHHFVITIGAGPSTAYDNPPMFIYMDGAEVYDASDFGGTGTKLGSSTPLKLYISKGASGTSTWTGYINDVAFFDTVLDADAVAAMYNSGDPTDLRVNSGNYDNKDNLTGYWWMGDEDTYPTITDRSGNGNDGTMTNMDSGDIESEVP